MPSKTWTEYEALVLSELKRLNETVNDLRDEMGDKIEAVKEDLSDAKDALKEQISTIKQEVAIMKVRSSLLGSVSGALSSVVVHLTNIFHK